ncbi:hypothetical protein PanWU01x14_210430 [Parasponia andersonii]|uniref:Transmembrane protein n=1 Tax=Parasponia andersonii TaxID=3476 RepID=A0A2P5BTS4_PARAD|nr:hypothetical protein PanWU01x14_210430 [Parasponia andersonii]
MSSPAAPDLEAGAQLQAPGLGADGHHNMGWAGIMVAFCFAWAVNIPFMSPQVHSRLSPAFLLVSLVLLFGFTSFFVSKFVGHKYRTTVLVLERAGVFFVVTGFFVAISIPFPMCLRVITWVVYVVSFLVVVVCSYFYHRTT